MTALFTASESTSISIVFGDDIALTSATQRCGKNLM